MGALRFRGSLEEGDEACPGHAGRPAILKNKVCHLSFQVSPFSLMLESPPDLVRSGHAERSFFVSLIPVITSSFLSLLSFALFRMPSVRWSFFTQPAIFLSQVAGMRGFSV